MLVYCSNCGTELPDGVSFCDVCGTPVRGKNSNAPAGSPSGADPGPAASQAANQANGIGTTSCPVCGAATLPGEAFCDNCGAALLTPTSYTHAPVPQPAQQFGAPPSYSQSPLASTGMSAATGYAPAHTLTASFLIAQPPPPATIQIPDRPELIVGRSDPQSNSYPDVDLGPYGGLDLGVSRRHFRLTRNGEHFYLEDLNAMNGSIINGQRIPPYTLHPLRSGDRITLGKMEIAFDIS
ncbi:MAG: FHA domain-containing protein [Chloroflexota bacterium]